MNTLKVQIVIFDGFDELDGIAPYEIWSMAKDLRPEVDVQLVTLEPVKEVTASHGSCLLPQGQLGIQRPNIVVVPGGGWLARSPTGAWTEARRGALPARLAQLHGDGVVMTSVCTGAMLLSAAGLLKGRPATTNRNALEELRAAGVEAIAARVVDDGDVVTAGGVTSGLDLTLWLVERFLGADVAHTLEERLEYERRGTVWRRSGKRS
jgi:transcriptional regulator GlxA family with amidase domain